MNTRQNLPAFLMIAAGLLLAAGGLYFYFTSNAVEEAPPPVEAPLAMEDSSVDIDVDAALAPRTLGNTSAPNKITEFASLSCGHCAAFHKGTLPELKETYIDTGQAYIVFVDFPLNKPALDGTMVARCLPANQYYDFVSLLFKNQEDWAFTGTHEDKLKLYAQTFGMSEETFDACLANEDLRDGLMMRLKAAQKQFGISSTPSFAINNRDVIAGNTSIDAFADYIIE